MILLSFIFVDAIVNISCKGSILSVEEGFIELEEADGKGNDGSSKQNKSIHINLIEYDDNIPKPNKSGRSCTITGCVGFEIDGVECEGVIDIVRSLPICRTGLFVD